MNLARQQTLADLSCVALAEQEWTLAVHCERWRLLKGMDSEAKLARQRPSHHSAYGQLIVVGGA